MTYKNLIKVAAVALLGAGLVLGGCKSSSSNKTPSNESDGGSKSTAGKGGSTKDAGSDAGKANDAGAKDAGKTDAGSKDAGKSDGGSSGCAKDSSKDCYTCDMPTTDDQFLNHCTSATCTAYDNSKLTKIVNGKLPDLP